METRKMREDDAGGTQMDVVEKTVIKPLGFSRIVCATSAPRRSPTAARAISKVIFINSSAWRVETMRMSITGLSWNVASYCSRFFEVFDCIKVTIFVSGFCTKP